jgi:hypothetical protein
MDKKNAVRAWTCSWDIDIEIENDMDRPWTWTWTLSNVYRKGIVHGSNGQFRIQLIQFREV